MPSWVRVVAAVAALVGGGRGSAGLHGARADAAVPAVAFLRLSFPGSHSVWLGLGALPEYRPGTQVTRKSGDIGYTFNPIGWKTTFGPLASLVGLIR